MSVIVPAEGIILDQILEKTGAGHGLTPAALRKFNNALSQTSWGQTHQHHMALMDGSDVLACAQRYDFMGMLDQCPAPQGFLGHLIAREFSQEECRDGEARSGIGGGGSP